MPKTLLVSPCAFKPRSLVCYQALEPSLFPVPASVDWSVALALASLWVPGLDPAFTPALHICQRPFYLESCCPLSWVCAQSLGKPCGDCILPSSWNSTPTPSPGRLLIYSVSLTFPSIIQPVLCCGFPSPAASPLLLIRLPSSPSASLH